jgi:hypothetical protein
MKFPYAESSMYLCRTIAYCTPSSTNRVRHRSLVSARSLPARDELYPKQVGFVLGTVGFLLSCPIFDFGVIKTSVVIVPSIKLYFFIFYYFFLRLIEVTVKTEVLSSQRQKKDRIRESQPFLERTLSLKDKIWRGMKR